MMTMVTKSLFDDRDDSQLYDLMVDEFPDPEGYYVGQEDQPEGDDVDADGYDDRDPYELDVAYDAY